MNVLWTEPAARAFRSLSRPLQQAILDRIDLISEFPEMYAIREHHPYAGFRYFFTRNWCVSYASSGNSIMILAGFPSRIGG